MEKNKTSIVSKPEFIIRLKEMNSKISKVLLEILTDTNNTLLNENYPNFLEIKNDNNIWYVTNKKSQEFLILVNKDNEPIERWVELSWSKNRQSCKPGRFISLLLNPEGFKHYGITDKDVQEFTQEWGKFLKDDKEFFIVKGKDIQFWYNKINYARPENEYIGSTLWKSCMADSSKNKFMELYSINKVYSLLILKDSNNKIWGRALLIDDGKLKVMDRVYYINEVIFERFRDWARKNEFIYKVRQSHDTYKSFFIKEKGKEIEKSLELSYKIEELPKSNYYPYVDTFFYLYSETKIMSNYLNIKLGKRCLELRNPSGGYSDKGWCEHNKNWYPFSDLRQCSQTKNYYHYSHIIPFNDKPVYKELVVASKFLKRNILKSESIKVLFDNDWVTKDDVVFSKFHGGYILKNKSIPHPTNKEDFIHSDKMQYSGKYKKHILMDETVIRTIDGIWMYNKDCVKINGMWFDKDDVITIKDNETGKKIQVSKKHLDETGQLTKTRRSLYFEGESINTFRSIYSKINYSEIKDLYKK